MFGFTFATYNVCVALNGGLNLWVFEMDNTSIKYMRKFGEKTLLPGIIIFSIGYFGSTYKFGQKETIIKNSDIIIPKISDFLNQNEVKKIIDMYNNVNNWIDLFLSF